MEDFLIKKNKKENNMENKKSNKHLMTSMTANKWMNQSKKMATPRSTKSTSLRNGIS